MIYEVKNAKKTAPTKPVSQRMVRCVGCGRLISYEAAYCVVKGPKREYYCSREEYEGGDAYRSKRAKFEDGILNAVRRIVCYDQASKDYSFDDGLYNTFLMSWAKNATFEKIYYYLSFEGERIESLIARKGIERVTSRLKYLNAVVLSNIADYEVRRISPQSISEKKLTGDVDVDMYKPNMGPRRTLRRSMEELEDKYGS